MLVRQFLKPCPKSYFRKVIKDLLMEGLEPILTQEGTEVNLYYNHPEGLPKRMVARMGWFKTNHYCAEFLQELKDIEETVRKEWGL